MYCRNCGDEIKRKDTACETCGMLARNGNKYCPHCGAPIVNQEDMMCPSCNQKIEGPADIEYSPKSRALAGHLGIFFGFLGIHNFYLGYVTKGIVKILMLTFGILLCGMGPFISIIWGFIEGIYILCDNFNYDAKGRRLRALGQKRKKIKLKK